MYNVDIFTSCNLFTEQVALKPGKEAEKAIEKPTAIILLDSEVYISEKESSETLSAFQKQSV